MLYNSISYGVEPIVKTRIISDQAVLTVSDTLKVGILFTIPEGYHIYWQNPGDAGLRPTVDMKCPDGFKMGPLYWPLPDQLEEAGGLKVNIYTNEVLLYADVLTPTHYRETSVLFEANLEWMVCKETCVLEKSFLNLTLPFSKKSQLDEATKPIFNRYEKLVPRLIQEFPYLTVSSDLKEDENEINDAVMREIHIKSLDLSKTFILDGNPIQWFKGSVEDAITETVSFDQGKSNPQLLVFHLEMKGAKKQKKTKSDSWGVVKFKMKMDNDNVLQQGLIIDFK